MKANVRSPCLEFLGPPSVGPACCYVAGSSVNQNRFFFHNYSYSRLKDPRSSFSQEQTRKAITVFSKTKEQTFSNIILHHFPECGKVIVTKTSPLFRLTMQNSYAEWRLILENVTTNTKLVVCPFVLLPSYPPPTNSSLHSELQIHSGTSSNGKRKGRNMDNIRITCLKLLIDEKFWK